MGGGQTIVYGILVLLVFLGAITMGGMFKPLGTLVLGSIPLLCIAFGVILLYMGLGERRSKQAKAGGSDAAS